MVDQKAVQGILEVTLVRFSVKEKRVVELLGVLHRRRDHRRRDCQVDRGIRAREAAGPEMGSCVGPAPSWAPASAFAVEDAG